MFLYTRLVAGISFFIIAATGQRRVKTTSGDVIGHFSAWKPNVTEYLGVPYARSPTGELRWALPQLAVADPVYPIVASKYVSFPALLLVDIGRDFVEGAVGDLLIWVRDSDCPANVRTNHPEDAGTPRGEILGYLGQEGHSFDEDCLKLNIWVMPQAGERNKAVLVWIGGFGFEVGSSAAPIYNGARLAEDHDVVVVSINYRLNIFGFPGAKFLPHQNLGLLDQRMALKWIRDNIGDFGGDSARITLFGNSAGASSIDMYRYAWPNDPIAAGFITQSGSHYIRGGGPWVHLAGRIGPNNSVINPTTQNDEIIGLLSGGEGDTTCGGIWLSEPRGPFFCNQEDAWFAAAERLGCGGKGVAARTLPCMRSKSWKQILNAIRPTYGTIPAFGTGDFGPIADEKLVFSDYINRTKAGNVSTRPLLSGNTRAEIGLFSALVGLSSNFVDIFIPNFPIQFLLDQTRMMLNFAFTCGAIDAIRAHRQAGLRAWRYEYAGEFPNLNISVRNGGSFHGSEVPLIFGTSEYSLKRADTEQEKKLGEKMRIVWTTFAKDPENGLQKLGWPLYSARDYSAQVFGDGPWWHKAAETPLKTNTSICLESFEDLGVASPSSQTGTPTSF